MLNKKTVILLNIEEGDGDQKIKGKNTLRNAFNRSAREWIAMKTRNMAKTYTRRDKGIGACVFCRDIKLSLSPQVPYFVYNRF
jgi:hypothetical protein